MDTIGARSLLFVISGPSGSGKKTFIQHITHHFPEIKHVPTYTTRPPRSGETPNVDYIFVNEDEFFHLLEAGKIYEYTRTYGDQLYGSPRCLIEGNDEQDLIVEMDYKGMFRIRTSSSRCVVSIFIVPPSLDILSQRIEEREQEPNIQNRLTIASEQLQFAWAYDYVLLNANKDRFLQNAACIVKAELLRKKGINYLLAHRHHHDYTLKC